MNKVTESGLSAAAICSKSGTNKKGHMHKLLLWTGIGAFAATVGAGIVWLYRNWMR